MVRTYPPPSSHLVDKDPVPILIPTPSRLILEGGYPSKQRFFFFFGHPYLGLNEDSERDIGMPKTTIGEKKIIKKVCNYHKPVLLYPRNNNCNT